jgi:hypothetical protein
MTANALWALVSLILISFTADAFGQTPYGGAAQPLPGRIEAEYYDEGGEMDAYHDTTTGNSGGEVRTDNVDIQANDGGYNVGWTIDGEWLEFTVNVTAGICDLQARVAAITSGKQVVVKLDGVTLGTINVPNTASWSTFQTVTVPNVSIAGGSGKILRVEFVGGSANLNWVDLVSTAPDTDPPTPNPATFSVAPAAIGSTAISMTATIGSDASGPVEYLFTETSGNPGGTTGSWQTNPFYIDSGLTAATQYTYTVTLRDNAGNTGTVSNPASATTQAQGAFPSVTKIGDTLVDSQAMTLNGGPYGYAINSISFQQDMLVTYGGWQYAAYYNGAGHVCVARRLLPSGPWLVAELTDYTISTTTDAHNTISMGICPKDETIHLSFDHHGNEFNYRVSQAGTASSVPSTWTAEVFDPVRNYLIPGQPISSVTYPRFWQTPDGNLQMSYRDGSSSSGRLKIADYTGASGTELQGQWSNIRQVTSSDGSYTDQYGTTTARNAYMNSLGYGPDGKLHASWTWRSSQSIAGETLSLNYNIMYAYSNDGGFTWYNGNPPATDHIFTGNSVLQNLFSTHWVNEGLQLIGDTSAGLLIGVNSLGVTAANLDRTWGIMNQQTQAVDDQGRVHVVMYHCTPESYVGYDLYLKFGPVGARRYNHYWQNAQGVWTRNELQFDPNNPDSYVGQRPKFYIRSNGDAYVIYQSWPSSSLTSTDIYIPDGNLVIQAATEASQWTDWQIVHVEPGPFLGESLGDPYRFRDGVLSVAIQDSTTFLGESTPLRVLDFQLN